MMTDPVSLSFVGVLVDEQTGAECYSTWHFRQSEDGEVSMDIMANGSQTTHHLGVKRGRTIRTLHASCFGGDPGGHGGRVDDPINDPINLDRTPRNALRDLIARRNALEESAADD
jgi:hypothetical protein